MSLDFTLPDTDGTPTPLHVDGASAAVVVFTCNHCPYALAWHERIQDITRDYADRGVPVPQINANDADRYPRDSVEAMKARGDAGELAGPYLHDERQEVARAFDAKTTPDVFVVDATGVVTGARRTPTTATRAGAPRGCARRLDAVLAAARTDGETKPVGCSIKWK